MIRFKLICTSGHAPIYYLDRLLASLKLQKLSRLYTISIYVLKQNSDKNGLTKYWQLHALTLTIYETPQSVSLSDARNMLISLSKDDDCDYVLFPDDDCYYSNSFFYDLANLVEDINKDVSFSSKTILSIPVYDPSKDRYFGRRSCTKPTKINQWNLTILPISVGIIMPSEALYKYNLRFNTNLGAGTHLSAGEETLLLSRLIYERSFQCLHLPSPRVFHDLYDPTTIKPSKVFNYSRASSILSLYLLYRYKIIGPIAVTLLFTVFSLFRLSIALFKSTRHFMYYSVRLLGSICGLAGLSYLSSLNFPDTK